MTATSMLGTRLMLCSIECMDASMAGIFDPTIAVEPIEKALHKIIECSRNWVELTPKEKEAAVLELEALVSTL